MLEFVFSSIGSIYISALEQSRVHKHNLLILSRLKILLNICEGPIFVALALYLGFGTCYGVDIKQLCCSSTLKMQHRNAVMLLKI